MNGAFYIGATGLHAQQRALDVVANNIANINTPAFKRSEVRFSELVAPPPQSDGATAAPGAEFLGGVLAGRDRTIFAQGDLKQTGDPTHLAIRGDGFVELLGPAGQTLLWRGGALIVNPDGYLAAENGMALKAMISVPLETTQLVLDADGQVRAAGQEAGQSLGQIELVRVKDAEALSPLGEGLYAADDPSALFAVAPGEDGAGLIVQGALESSNAELSDEMILLLLMQRAYAANAQLVQAGDQLMAIANGLKR